MESQIERISPVECRVRVEIPWSEVSSRLGKKMKNLQRQARIPGFRRGKVPSHVVERMFGKSVREEVARDLVQETFPTAVSQHDQTRPLSEPVVESSTFQDGSAFIYAARFEVVPQVEPKDYVGVDVRRRPSQVSEESVTEQLQQKRKEFAQLQPLASDPPRENTQSGDVWTLDLEGKIGETVISRKDLQIEIGSNENEVVPGLSDALAALKISEVGSTKTIKFVPPSDRVREQFRDKEAEFKVALREVREKILPELDDEFARDTGIAESFDELKKKIREQLLEADGEEAEIQARKRLVETLLERNPVEVSPTLVAQETKAQVDAFQQQVEQGGMTLAQVGTSPELLTRHFRGQATFNVRAFLLLNAIGNAESIEVSEDELTNAINELAEEQGQNPAKLRATMTRNQQLILLQAQLREQKILDFLMSKSNVTEAPDPVEEKKDDEAGGAPDAVTIP